MEGLLGAGGAGPSMPAIPTTCSPPTHRAAEAPVARFRSSSAPLPRGRRSGKCSNRQTSSRGIDRSHSRCQTSRAPRRAAVRMPAPGRSDHNQRAPCLAGRGGGDRARNKPREERGCQSAFGRGLGIGGARAVETHWSLRNPKGSIRREMHRPLIDHGSLRHHRLRHARAHNSHKTLKIPNRAGPRGGYAGARRALASIAAEPIYGLRQTRGGSGAPLATSRREPRKALLKARRRCCFSGSRIQG
jgi:hypothetical protein